MHLEKTQYLANNEEENQGILLTAHKGEGSLFSHELQATKADRFEAFINASDIGAWQYFPESGFSWCNEAYFSMLGRDKDDYDFSGKANLSEVWTDFLHPEDRDKAVDVFSAFMDNPEGTHESYYRMKHADGSWVWIWSRGRLFNKGSEGSAISAIGTHVDITKHKKAEEAIERELLTIPKGANQ